MIEDIIDLHCETKVIHNRVSQTILDMILSSTLQVSLVVLHNQEIPYRLIFMDKTESVFLFSDKIVRLFCRNGGIIRLDKQFYQEKIK